jgi:hypothetical protein
LNLEFVENAFVLFQDLIIKKLETRDGDIALTILLVRPFPSCSQL